MTRRGRSGCPPRAVAASEPREDRACYADRHARFMPRATHSTIRRNVPPRKLLLLIMANPTLAAARSAHDIESPYAWARLFASLVLSTIGGVALWSTPVVLPAIQTQFAVDRAAAALPYTAAML